ncbi:MAG: tRNA glutamyl-Q(34) synthetase GluQRS [Gammaproteobacteria bacterium]
MSSPATSPKTVGRFAPSPTGPLHLGSVVAALGSFLCARAAGGEWLVRIDDLDPPRERPGAAADILRTLERLGLYWDREVSYQRTRRAAHRDACATLLVAQRAYRCRCSRKLVGSTPYPSTCRERGLTATEARRVRLRVDAGLITIDDELQGRHGHDLAMTTGDFVIWRAENLPAYHLATVVDDAALGITEVIRGADLLDVTPHQVFLQRALNFPQPSYLHLPIAVDSMGRKISKHDRAPTVAALRPAMVIRQALRFLGHEVPPPFATLPVSEILNWAISHWQRSRLPAYRTLPASCF